jgi:hypothetical protein
MSFSRVAALLICAVAVTALADEQRIGLAEWNACGPSALYGCARVAGVEVTRDQVIRLCGVGADGECSVADLVRAARALGFNHAVAVQTTVDELSRLRLLAIVHDGKQKPAHFVAVIGQREHEFLVFSPPPSPYWLSKRKAAQGWDGYAVLLSREPIPGLGSSSLSSPAHGLALGLGLGAGALLGLAVARLPGFVHRQRTRNSASLLGAQQGTACAGGEEETISSAAASGVQRRNHAET